MGNIMGISDVETEDGEFWISTTLLSFNTYGIKWEQAKMKLSFYERTLLLL
jgi:hypothetical protein